jgi:hypothetical protein
MFGPSPAGEFGPKVLKAVREAWVAARLSRKVINGRVGWRRWLFVWAALGKPDDYTDPIVRDAMTHQSQS